MKHTPFGKLAQTCERLARTRSKLEKAELVGAFLREIDEEEIETATRMLLGKVFADYDPRTLEISGSTIRQALDRSRGESSKGADLTIPKVRQLLEQIAASSGGGARRKKLTLLGELLERADPQESKWLVKIIFGEMQHGVGEGVMLEAIAGASGAALRSVRRAVMLSGDIGRVSRVALMEGPPALEQIGLSLFHPVQPMLAQLAEGVGEALAEQEGTSALEFKFDGARVQIHRRHHHVRIYSRRLSDVTESLPDVVQLARERLKTAVVVVEGEVVAVDQKGRPLPFQEVMRRFRRIRDVPSMVAEVPVRLYLFDALYAEKRALIDLSYRERWEVLSAAAPADLLAPRLVTSDPAEAQAFLERAMAEGHEGLMAKALDSAYQPGSRGKKWLKIKPAEHLDLVVVAADWGYGRRTGWLSNYHLAARDPESGEFLVIGKTFKGLTDEQFRWMTEKLKSLKIGETRGTVTVRPEVVVEVAYNEIQRSPHYRSSFALRFARIKRIRNDKSPEQSDSIERLRVLYEKQFERKGRSKETAQFK